MDKIKGKIQESIQYCGCEGVETNTVFVMQCYDELPVIIMAIR